MIYFQCHDDIAKGEHRLKISIITDFYFHTLSDTQLGEIQAAAPGYEISQVEQKEVTAADLMDSEIVFGRIPPHLLIELKNLKWLHLGSAGANGMTDISLYANKSVILTKSSGTFGIVVADYIIGAMISLSRSFGYYYDKQRNGEWCPKLPEFFDISGSTVLLVGLGSIGTEVSRRLSAFGCHIIGFRHDVSKPHEIVSDIRPLSRLRESLPEADYVILCAPGTAETNKRISHVEFDLMKKRAIVINVGRGMIIDTDALNDALRKQKIAGAGLDVTEPEPLPEGHPLWSAPNVFITPHVSALTQVTSERRLAIFVDLLKRYLTGQEMYNFVDFNAGY